MQDLKSRLEAAAAALDEAAIERELRELELDIISDPGALEPLLLPVRLRKQRRNQRWS